LENDVLAIELGVDRTGTYLNPDIAHFVGLEHLHILRDWTQQAAKA
jgi:hypothetical protein